MKIQIKQNIDGLFAIDKLCNIILDRDEQSFEAKMVKSIIKDVSKLVSKPLEKAIESNNLFDSKKKHNITLKYHEAYALHQGIMLLIGSVNNELYKTKLNIVKDNLNRNLV